MTKNSVTLIALGLVMGVSLAVFADLEGNGGFLLVTPSGKVLLADTEAEYMPPKTYSLDVIKDDLEKIRRGLIDVGLREKEVNQFFAQQVNHKLVDYLLVDKLPENCKDAMSADRFKAKHKNFAVIQGACTKGFTTWLLSPAVDKELETDSQAALIVHERLRAWRPAESDRVIIRFIRLVRLVQKAQLTRTRLEAAILQVDGYRAAAQLGFPQSN